MKRTIPLSAFGLIAVVAAGALNVSAATADESASGLDAPESVAAAGDRLAGTFRHTTHFGLDGYLWGSPDEATGEVMSGQMPTRYSFPAVGSTGPVVDDATGLCLTAQAPQGSNLNALVLGLQCEAGSTSQEWSFGAIDERTYLYSVASGERMFNYGGKLGVGPASPIPVDMGLLSLDEQSASITTPMVHRGETVDVEAQFSASEGIRVIDIAAPDGTLIVGASDPAFTITQGRLTGRLPANQTTVAFTLMVQNFAPIGEITGGDIGMRVGAERVVLSTWSVDVLADDAPLVVTQPGVGGVIGIDASGKATPVFSGTATPGADVEIVTLWDDLVGSTVADEDGAWEIEWDKALKPAHYSGGRTIQSIDGVELDRVKYDFTVTASDVALTSPANAGIIPAGPAGVVAPTFTGTGAEGARIDIYGAWGTMLGTGVVVDGTWSIEWTKELKPGTYRGGLVKQYLTDSGLHSTVGYDFTVVAADASAPASD
ncbi:hypothetical protein KXS11_09920 [Plantibacter flavus]|uniref:hypothetical protein n=1 Tax=Plantibacter flavus TaxID=150123 RepID=UPI003F16AE9C